MVHFCSYFLFLYRLFIVTFYIADNALYDDNGATINAVTYDAKELYEPLNDNESSEQKKFVCCTCFDMVVLLHILFFTQLTV